MLTILYLFIRKNSRIQMTFSWQLCQYWLLLVINRDERKKLSNEQLSWEML